MGLILISLHYPAIGRLYSCACSENLWRCRKITSKSSSCAGISLSDGVVEAIKQALLSDFNEKEDSQPESGAKSATLADSEAGHAEENPEDKASKESAGLKKKEKTKSLDALLKARKSLIQEVSQQLDKPFDVSLNGVETGEIEAVVKAKWEYDQVFYLSSQNFQVCFHIIE